MPEKNCPLCNADNIPYKEVDFGRAKLFYCPNCKDFVTALNAEIRLNQCRTDPGLKNDPKVADLLKDLSKDTSSVTNGKIMYFYIENDTEKTLAWEEKQENFFN